MVSLIDKKQLNKKNLKNLFRPLIAIIFLTFLIKKGPFQFSQIQFIFLQPQILLLGLILLTLQFALVTLRWKTIVELATHLRFKPALIYTLIGHFFSFLIPGGVGGDVIKAVELSKSNKITKRDALSTVVADRLMGLYSMVLFSTLFLAADYLSDFSAAILKYFFFSLILLIAMTLGVVIGPFLIGISSKVINSKDNKIIIIIEKLITSFSLTFTCFRNPKVVLRIFTLSLLIQIISNVFMLEIVKTLGVPTPTFFVFFALSCFGFLASAIPITPAGIGVGQAAVYFLFSSLSQQLGQAAVTAISVLQIFYLFFALIGGLLFTAKPLFKNISKETV